MSMFVEPHGIQLLHWWNEVGCLLKTVRAYKVKLFVEIGMFHGALSRILLDQCLDNPQFRYLGIEQDRDHIDDKVIRLCDQTSQAEILIADAHSPETVEIVRSKIQAADSPALIYCDGGDKILEAKLYWPLIRKGDLFGVHDYGAYGFPGIEVFPDDVWYVRQGTDEIEMLDTRILMVRKP